jgi:predicted  nucleic acid-binding Zn-ribbon protein
MKKYSISFAALFFAAVILSVGLTIFSSDINAQTRKKTTKKTTKTTTQPKPIYPIVVTQADQYQTTNQQIITGNTQNTEQSTQNQVKNTQNETLEQKIDRLNERIAEMNARMSSLEKSQKNDYDEKQRRLALNLEILTKAEQRAESLRKQLYDLIAKENELRTKLEQIQYDLRPEMIDRQIAFAGTLRPEELRDMRRKNLETEKRNTENLLAQLQVTRETLELNVQKADQLVEKLRFKLEKDIDDALAEDEK